ncbi:MAG TPA: cystine transporter permease, partial [Peptococcaceae bacterium]|nr:cystine transporter permease [Peptococcaceae bacterium]
MINIYQLFIENASIFLEATVVTLKLTTISLLLAMVIGLVIAFCKISNNRILFGIAQLYITVIRG